VKVSINLRWNSEGNSRPLALLLERTEFFFSDCFLAI